MSRSATFLEFPDPAIRSLYDRARHEQWSVDRDVRWGELPLEMITGAIRHAMAEIYSQIHAGEMIALHACGRLIDSLGEGWPRRLVETQVTDETRHVAFFSTVIDRLDSPLQWRDPMQALADEANSLRCPVELFTALHLLEAAAHTVLLMGARTGKRLLDSNIRLPGSGATRGLLTTIVDLVGRDESRHIALSARYLIDRVPQMPHRDRSSLNERAHGWSKQLQAVVRDLDSSLRRLGLAPAEVEAHVWRVQRHNLMRAGIDIGERPDALADAGA